MKKSNIKNKNGDAKSKADSPAGEHCNFAFRSRGGYAALAMTLLVIFASLTIIGGLTFFSLQEVAINRIYSRSVTAHYVAEGGIEDATWRLLAGKQFTGPETITAGGGSVLTSMTTGPDGSKVIRSQGTVGSLQQTSETRLQKTISPTPYAMQYWKDAE